MAYQKADVGLLLDTTCSMGPELVAMQEGVAALSEGVLAAVPDTRFALGTYEDYPAGAYGSSCADQAFRLVQAATGDRPSVPVPTPRNPPWRLSIRR